MPQKPSVTKELETAQEKAAEALERTRTKIRKQSAVTSYEYCLLYEDAVSEAKAGAERIETLMARAAKEDRPTLMLVCNGDALHLMLAMSPYLTLACKTWAIHGSRHLTWRDSKPALLQTMQTNLLDTGKYLYTYPLHSVLADPNSFIAFGELDVAARLVTVEKPAGKPPHYDRFNFFYDLTRKLGYELKDKKLLKRVEEERERVSRECEQHLKSLEGLFEELFFRGPRDPYPNFKGDASSHLVNRIRCLSESIRDTCRECSLYQIDTDASRELIAFARRWDPLTRILP